MPRIRAAITAIAVTAFAAAVACTAQERAKAAAEAAEASRNAVALCVAYRQGGMPDADAARVADQFCRTAKQLAPFVEAAAQIDAPDAGK